MDELQIFTSTEFGEVRTAEIDGKPYFAGKDIATALGYVEAAKAIREHCKGVSEIDTPTKGGLQKMKYISEGDVYRLIAHSKLPTAERFERWVFDEVLPSIRKHGMYAIDEIIENPDLGIKALTALKEERERRKALENTVAVQTQQIAELTPKASYYDVVLNTKDLLAISKIAKDYGKSAVWLNDWLHSHGIQYKQGDIWLLYQRYAEMGYTSTKTQTYSGNNGEIHSKVHTYWTQKGRLFIYEQLKSNGILPLIERSEKGNDT